jgi:hypothetical protein
MGLPRWPDTAWWSACVEGLPRWLWAATLAWVGLLAAWACSVHAQTGRSTDGGTAGRGMSPRERLVFVLLVSPAAAWLLAWLKTHLLAG